MYENTKRRTVRMDSIGFSADHFSVGDIFTCGQAFRFREQPDGGFSGVALGEKIALRQSGREVTVSGKGVSSLRPALCRYFALDIDYGRIKDILSRDPVMKEAIAFAPGIRVLRQPLFETLITFIVSQVNHLTRIAGIVERLSRQFGSEKDGFFDFPTPAQLAGQASGAFAPVRCGFRDRYIADAAEKWVAGEIDPDFLRRAPLREARDMLKRIRGVGSKVADCTLLFGAARFDAFPEDVWIRRAMAELFPKGLPADFRPIAGIAQQYLFHYIRNRGRR